MNACAQFCDDLADLVFSGLPKEVVIERSTLMLRLVLEEHPEGMPIPTDGFNPALLDRFQNLYNPLTSPSGDIRYPANYNAGEEVGRLIGQALNGKIDRSALRSQLRSALCES